jgi:ATPase subunit of ABC transporter with duplicated ATPase domains
MGRKKKTQIKQQIKNEILDVDEFSWEKEYIELIQSLCDEKNPCEHDLISRGYPPSFVRIRKFHNLIQSPKSKVKNIVFKNLCVEVPGKKLISNSNLTLSQGKKYGLIGRNGTGKTSLLKYISGKIKCHSPFMMEQTIEETDLSAIDVVLSSDRERTWLLEEQNMFENNSNYGENKHYDLTEIHERQYEIRADSAYSRAANILNGLGFDSDDRKKSMKELSGGWKMRVILACTLFMKPDVLLLDEPTNHLDLHGTLWLEDYIVNIFKGTLLLVSHDVEFINNTVDEIIHLHMEKLTMYQGNYGKFKKQRLIDQKSNNDKYHEYIKTKKSLIKSLNDAKEKDKHIFKKKLENLQQVDQDVEEKSPKLIFPEPENIGYPILQFIDVTFCHGDDQNNVEIFRDVDFGIDMKSKIGLVGQNGAGKTTLMNLMCGDLQPNKGEVKLNRKLRISRFEQNNISSLPENISPLEYFSNKFRISDEQIIRKHLSCSGLTKELQTKKIQYLSGGQKARVCFSELTWKNPHLIFLDEPTNHLDMETIDALSESLKKFTGGFMLITHNTYILSNVCEEIWLVGNKNIIPFRGTFDEYKKEIIDKILK